MSLDVVPIETYVIAPLFREVAADRPKLTEALPAQRQLYKVSTGDISSDSKSNLTGTVAVADLFTKVAKRDDRNVLQKGTAFSASFSKARDDRINLLARKYGGKLGTEGQARLDILTARVGAMNPRVKPIHRKNLAELEMITEELGDSIADLRQRFGL